MLSRFEVFDLVERERQYQDTNYDPRQLLSSGQSRGQRDLDVTPGLVLLDSYVRKAQDAWTDNKKIGNDGSLIALQNVAKIAAIAVRILERAGGSEKLLEKGLR